LVVLKWLVDFFEAGISYSEAQVNAILKLHHHVWATLRREMVGYGMLARDRAIYWRSPESEWRIAGK
jgi:hypothetical protein